MPNSLDTGIVVTVFGSLCNQRASLCPMFLSFFVGGCGGGEHATGMCTLRTKDNLWEVVPILDFVGLGNGTQVI